jgi:hypothetical protein
MPKRVYLIPEALRHSAYHTAYVGEGAVHEDGRGSPLYKLEFIHGVAYDVEEQLYQRFKDAGIADVNRPTRPDEEG